MFIMAHVKSAMAARRSQRNSASARTTQKKVVSPCGNNNVKLIKKLGWQENGFQLPAVILKLKEKVATKSGVLQQPALP